MRALDNQEYDLAVMLKNEVEAVRSNQPIPYREVPPSAAGDVGKKYKKARVILVSYDKEHDRTHMTTWGETADDKARAAGMGDKIIGAVAMVGQDSKTFEDFRQAGVTKERLDVLIQNPVGKALDALMVRAGVTPEAFLAAVTETIDAKAGQTMLDSLLELVRQRLPAKTG